MPDRSVTVTATGRASAPPDLLTADLTIGVRAAAAGDALREANERSRALLAELAASGVDVGDVATTAVRLGPEWDREGQPDGYRAEHAVRAQLRDLGRAGDQLDAAVRAAGDAGRIDAVALGLADDAALRSAARADAMAQARRQATELAEVEDAQVGDVLTITELAPGGGVGFPKLRAMAASADGVPIAAGTHEVSIEVEATFALS